MCPPTYQNQETWKEIQQYLPQRLAFTKDHLPVEEWWVDSGHKIHLDRWRNTDAKLLDIPHDGVGTNGRQMSVIHGIPLHEAGFELIAIDIPGYVCTKPAANVMVSYDDWIQIARDFIDFELHNDPRPIVFYGPERRWYAELPCGYTKQESKEYSWDDVSRPTYPSGCR